MIRKPKRLEVLVPLASMGDVAFLLIIFFVLTSNFMKENKIDLELPRIKGAEKVEKSLQNVSIDKEGNVYYQGNRTYPGSIAGTINNTFENGEEKEREVKLTADADLPASQWKPVFDSIAEVSPTIQIAAEKGIEKKGK